MKKALTLITFLSMASIAIAQCPGSKAEEYKRKLQEHNQKSPREKAELPGMLGQAYSQAASYYMYKCMCENGYAKNEEGKKEIAAAANASADFFNSANISGEPKLSKINPGSCTLAGKGKSGSGNESANYVVPEKGLFFNNRMMSNLNAIAAESDNEELKTIVKEMNEVHGNANYMRQNYGLDQEQTEMLNTWENISQVATILVANSMKKDQEYFEKLERERKEMERLADNMSYGQLPIIEAGIEKVIDSLKIEYLYPFYLTKNEEYKQYLLKEFDRSITSYYPITDLYREMLQQYYVTLDLNNNYKVNMQLYPWVNQKDKFLEQYEDNGKQSWAYRISGSTEDRILIDLLHFYYHTSIWDEKTVMDLLRHNKLLTDEQRKSIMERKRHLFPEDFNIPYSHVGGYLKKSTNLDTLLLCSFTDFVNNDRDLAFMLDNVRNTGLDSTQIIENHKLLKEHEYLDIVVNYKYMYPIWINTTFDLPNTMDKILQWKEEEYINKLKVEYSPIADLSIKSFSDFGKLNEDDFKKIKKATVNTEFGKVKKYFSNTKLLLRITMPIVTFGNFYAHNFLQHGESQKALNEISNIESQLMNLYEVSDKNEITSAFKNRYLSSDDKKVICFDSDFFHRYFQLQCFKLEAQINLKMYEDAKKTLQEIKELHLIDYSTLSPSLIYTPFPKLFSFDYRAKFYPIYLSYLETGKVNKELFFDTFDDQLKILNLIEEWQVTHSDIEPILKFLN